MLNSINQVGFQLQNTLRTGFSIFGIQQSLSAWLLLAITMVSILLFSYICFFISKRYVIGFLEKIVNKHSSIWVNSLFEYQVISKLAHLVPAFIIYSSAPLITFAPALFSLSIAKIYKTLALAYMLVTIYAASSSFLDVLEFHYRNFRLANRQSVKSYFQSIKIIIFILVSILVISDILNKSPIYLLTSVGAIATVLLFVFKDTLLSFVANVQIALSDVLRLGDYIQADQYKIDGEVIDISLNQVRIRNLDKSITTVPTYLLLTGSLKNFRSIKESGVRLINRSLTIDITTLKFCNNSLLGKLSQKNIISKEKADNYLSRNDNLINAFTNLEIFRNYVADYLASHPKINHAMPILVRQLQGTDSGLPIELRCYITEQGDREYEATQASIFEHIYAIVKEFDLRIFQHFSEAMLPLINRGPQRNETYIESALNH